VPHQENFAEQWRPSITLRGFETFDVDWIFMVLVLHHGQRSVSIATNGTSIYAGRSLMTNGPLVVSLPVLTERDYRGDLIQLLWHSLSQFEQPVQTFGADDNRRAPTTPRWISAANTSGAR